MIQVDVTRDPTGTILRFRVAGHAGYADRGRDVVCAAVSVLSQAAVLGLEEIVGLEPEVRIEPGLLSCSLPEGLEAGEARRAQDILETVVLGLKNLALSNPGFVQVEESSSGAVQRS